MKTRAIWFKGEFVADILSGAKRDTIRQWKRLPKVGDVLSCCVGPRPPFALVRVESVEVARDIEPARRAALFSIYGPLVPVDLVRITFSLVKD
jgi:hypothetical protein